MRIPRCFFRFVTLSATMLAALVATQSSSSAQTFTVTPPSPGCQLLSAPAGTVPAFCDTFDKPEGIGNRAGALNGTVWGVSRYFGGINPGQGQFYDASPAGIDLCGTTFSVIDPNDVQICDGLVVESVFDQTTVTNLAMYPKQPFDISGGRTGTVAFDVSNDSHGTHSVWPELWYTDKPVPTPFVHQSSLSSVPANGFGIRIAGTCPANSGGGCGARGFCPEYSESVPVVTVDSAIIVNNYVVQDVGVFDNPPTGTLKVTDVDCVQASSGPGNMNHFEFRISQNEIDVYGIDAGATGPLKEIAIISNAGLTLTTGLLWIEDDHYNANKTSNGQGDHTFTWDNFAFDGPVIARDLAFDVLDALTPVGPGYPGLLNMGWNLDPNSSTPLTLTIPNVYNVDKADKAFLTFNFDDFNYRNLSTPTPFISYSLNNGLVQQAPFPFGPCPVQNGAPACGEYTIAVPVNLPDVIDGTNTIQFTATDGAAIANVDLILHGAAGIPCTTSCPATLPAPTITITPTPSTVSTAQGVSVAISVTSTSGPVPTGTVTLSAPGFISAATTLSGGSASISIPAGTLNAGPDLLTVTYSGDSNYSFASNNSSVTVNNLAPVANNASLEVAPSAYPSITTSDPFTLLIDLFGNGPLAPLTVTGTVTVTGGGYNSGAVPLSGGVATISIPPGGLADGADTFDVNYSGDSNFAAADYTNTLTINVSGPGGPPPPMTTPTITITPSAMSITTAQPLTVAVSVADSGNLALVATGTVTLSGGGISPQTVTLSNTGAASFTIAAGALAVGSDTLTVSYSGDSNYNATSNTATITVTNSGTSKTTPTITITPSSTNLTTDQQLTVGVNVAGSGNSAPTATGTVTLSGGGTTTEVLPLNNTGGATFTIPPGTLTVGSDMLTASYSGDSNYNVTTNTSTITVTGGTTTTPVSFTIAGTAVTITAGATTGNTSTITVTSSPACNCNVALTAAIASGPAVVQDPPTLSFGSTTPVNLMSSSSGTATLTITTTKSNTQASTGGKMPWLPAGGAALACAFLLGIPAGRRKWHKILATVLLLVALSLGLQGCTGPVPGSGGSTGTTPGTYVITVTGTSGTTTGTGTVTLTVH